MPEPFLYLKAMGAAAIVSAIFVMVAAGVGRSFSTPRLNLVCVLGMGFGLALGYYVLALRIAWPPKNGLDRLLTIVLPAALGIEWIAGFQRVPRWVVWLLRVSLALSTPRILLHGSVYLSGSGNGWTLWNAAAILALCGGLLAGVWGLISWLSQRSPGVSIPLALGLAIPCAGLTVMMAGYIKGGAAAFPLAATVVATTIATRLINKNCGTAANMRSRANDCAAVKFAAPGMIGIGVVGLFGLLFIGHFFGRLSAGSGLVMLFTPLLCWISETPILRNRKPWLVELLRLALVAIPLVVVLILAKRDFDRDMAPLLGKVQESSSGIRHGLETQQATKAAGEFVATDGCYRLVDGASVQIIDVDKSAGHSVTSDQNLRR